MTAKRQDFEITAGLSKDVNFLLTDGNAPLDLTGMSLSWRMGPLPNGEAVLQKTSQNGITVNGLPTAGSITLSIQDNDISDSGLNWHNLSGTQGGRTWPLASGRVIVNPNVGPES